MQDGCAALARTSILHTVSQQYLCIIISVSAYRSQWKSLQFFSRSVNVAGRTLVVALCLEDQLLQEAM